MRKIKLFEEYLSLPVDYTRNQIEKMSLEELFKALDKYKNSNDAEQALTLLSIWSNANRKSFDFFELSDKIGDYLDFLMPTAQSKSDVMDAIQKEEDDKKSKEQALKKIPELEMSIKHYEMMLARSKEHLEKLKSSLSER